MSNDPNNNASRGRERRSLRPCPTGPRVLVISEIAEEASRLSDAFISEGMRVVAAPTMQAAGELLSNHPIDVAVVSATVTGGGASAVFRTLKERRPLCQVLVITGRGPRPSGTHGVTNLISAIESGALDFFPRPLRDLGDVTTAVREALLRAERWRFALIGPIAEEVVA